MSGNMDMVKINKAAQLADDLKKVKRAIGLMSDANNGKVNIRISGTVNDEALFAYLPKRMVESIYNALIETEEIINLEMEEL